MATFLNIRKTVATGTYTDDITGLDEGTAYTFRVESIYGADQSSPPDTASATTDLSAPTDASANAPQPDQANVNWTGNETGTHLE